MKYSWLCAHLCACPRDTHAYGGAPPFSLPTHPAPMAGSLWDPNITVETLDSEELRVNFTLWNESTPYQILLDSFSHADNQSCFYDTKQIPAVSISSPSATY